VYFQNITRDRGSLFIKHSFTYFTCILCLSKQCLVKTYLKVWLLSITDDHTRVNTYLFLITKIHNLHSSQKHNEEFAFCGFADFVLKFLYSREFVGVSFCLRIVILEMWYRDPRYCFMNTSFRVVNESQWSVHVYFVRHYL